MKLRNTHWLVAVAVPLAVIGCSTQAHLKKEAKVSEDAARQTALAKVPGGSIKESELEREDGKLVWSFDISKAGTKDITEVQVDANTGQVVAMETESEEHEKKEKEEKK